MKPKGKKLLAGLLCLLLCLSMLPAASADEVVILDDDPPTAETAPTEEEKDSAESETEEPPMADGIPIDEEHFPDENFREFIREDRDHDEDGFLSENERNIWSLNCSGRGIVSLEGIEYFPTLFQLNCENNQIKELAPKLEALKYLSCEGNQLSEIDLSAVPALQQLVCYDNQIQTLDIRSCEKLVFAVEHPKVTSNENGRVRYFYYMSSQEYEVYCDETTALLYKDGIPIDEEHFPDGYFRRLYVAQHDMDNDGMLSSDEINAVTEISRPDGPPIVSITSVKGIEYFPNLEILNCGQNQLAEIDVSHNPKLRELYCYGGQLTKLDLSGNPALEKLECARNQLTSLDVSNCSRLTYLSCFDNQLQTLDVSHNPELEVLMCGYYLLAPEAYANDGNRIAVLDLSQNHALRVLYCNHNELVTLDLSQNPELTELYCNTNHLTSLNLQDNPKLEICYCFGNQLQTLDVSNNRLLRRLSCGNNQIQELDISENSNLIELRCEENSMKNLRLAKKDNLAYLICYGNQLNKVDIRDCPQLLDVVNKYDVRIIDEELGYASYGYSFYKHQYNDFGGYGPGILFDTSIALIYEDPTPCEEHTWDDGTVTKAATCEGAGEIVYTCTVCGETRTETLPATGHDWDEGEVVKEPTCTEPGQRQHHCRNDESHLGVSEIPSPGHRYEDGYCTACGEKDPNYTPKLIEGNGGTAFYGNDYTVKSDAAFRYFQKVLVDGKELSPENYTVKEGSTVVILKAEYIKTLSVGTHSIAIVSDPGTASGEFRVSDKVKTGDPSDAMLWAALLALSAMGTTSVTAYLWKKRKEEE